MYSNLFTFVQRAETFVKHLLKVFCLWLETVLGLFETIVRQFEKQIDVDETMLKQIWNAWDISLTWLKPFRIILKPFGCLKLFSNSCGTWLKLFPHTGCQHVVLKLFYLLDANILFFTYLMSQYCFATFTHIGWKDALPVLVPEAAD